MEIYDVAGGYRTSERANDVLRSMYADGTVCDGERPEVTSRMVMISRLRRYERRYFVTVHIPS